MRGETGPGLEGAHRPDHVDATDKATEPKLVLLVFQFRPAAPAARKYGEAIFVYIYKCLTRRVGQGCHHRDLLPHQLGGKFVFLQNSRITPAAGAIKFGHHEIPVFQANLVDPVFITVKGLHMAADFKTKHFHGI